MDNSILTLRYHPNHWRSHESQLYQIAARLLNIHHLLLAVLTCSTTESSPVVQHVGIYTPVAERGEASWELAYAIPPLAVTLQAWTSEL